MVSATTGGIGDVYCDRSGGRYRYPQIVGAENGLLSTQSERDRGTG